MLIAWRVPVQCSVFYVFMLLKKYSFFYVLEGPYRTHRNRSYYDKVCPCTLDTWNYFLSCIFTIINYTEKMVNTLSTLWWSYFNNIKVSIYAHKKINLNFFHIDYNFTFPSINLLRNLIEVIYNTRMCKSFYVNQHASMLKKIKTLQFVAIVYSKDLFLCETKTIFT